jgi:hypothetical protein
MGIDRILRRSLRDTTPVVIRKPLYRLWYLILFLIIQRYYMLILK